MTNARKPKASARLVYLSCMKNILIFIGIFALGVVTYALLDNYLTKKEPQQTATTTQTTITATTSDDTIEVESDIEDTVTVDEDGALHDGPYELLNADGEPTGTTVQIIRSPSEVLLQFDATLAHAPSSRLYFARSLDADNPLDLGPLRMQEEVLVYGIPLDADLSAYSYILIFDEAQNVVEYSADLTR